MNLTMLGADYRFSMGLGAAEPIDPFWYEGTAATQGQTAANASVGVQTKKPIDWSAVPAALRPWIELIEGKGIEYYRLYKESTAPDSQKASMDQALDWMKRNGYITVPGQSFNYTPILIGGAVVVVALIATGVIMKRRRR